MAAKKIGSRYKLGKRMDFAESTISEIMAGRRDLPVNKVPELSDIAGVEVDDYLHKVLIENEKDPIRKERLIAILGKVGAAGVAVLLGFSYNDTSNASTLQKTMVKSVFNQIYIVEYLTSLLYRFATCRKRHLVYQGG